MFRMNSNGDVYYSNIGPNGEVIQFEDNSIESNSSVYSDRMYQWDYKKFNKCCNEVFGNEGQYFYEDRTVNQIEEFLCKYLEKDIKLARITRYIHQSNGYPLWCFQYHVDKSE